MAQRVDASSDAITPLDPGADGLAQLLAGADRRILGERRLRLHHPIGNERRHRLARLANHQLDGRIDARLDAFKETPETRERRKDHALGERM